MIRQYRSLPAGVRLLSEVAFVTFILWGAAENTMATPKEAFKAGRQAKDSATRKSHFQNGMEQARAILKVQAENPEGLFWLAVNMGAEALERGKMSALPIVPQMERLLLKADVVAPEYEDAGPARVLGRLYHQAPAVISVGSSEKASKFLERALKLAPNHPGNQAFAADFLLEKGQEDRAKRLAAECLKTLSANAAKYGDEAREWKKIATDVVED